MTLPAAQAADTRTAFPPPEPGQVRHVLTLPPEADESAVKVELVVGRTVPTGAHNRYFFTGRIEEETIAG